MPSTPPRKIEIDTVSDFLFPPETEPLQFRCCVEVTETQNARWALIEGASEKVVEEGTGCDVNTALKRLGEAAERFLESNRHGAPPAR